MHGVSDLACFEDPSLWLLIFSMARYALGPKTSLKAMRGLLIERLIHNSNCIDRQHSETCLAR